MFMSRNLFIRSKKTMCFSWHLNSGKEPIVFFRDGSRKVLQGNVKEGTGRPLVRIIVHCFENVHGAQPNNLNCQICCSC